MKAIVKTQLDIPMVEAWELVKQSSTLVYVCNGLLGFEGSDRFPKKWREGDLILTRLKLFGGIPFWRHSLRFVSICDSSNIIYTAEKGGIVRVWNHKIKIEAKNKFTCVYTDTVEINAGLLTPIIWLFAIGLYRYRQKRWRTLIDR